MESVTQHAPPVVAVVVVHDPGPWFEETLDALGAQDYPNLRFLVLATDGDDSIDARVKVRLPGAFVRSLGGNPGLGAAANEVLQLVEGERGLFLFCHDDIAPAPDAVRTMVEELYRSNAGVVGPKLVDWDRPDVLQSVGLGIDRFGEIDQPIEPGEVDQEQHDGVRDVFAVPSACMLVRADLFREIGGFDPAITFHREDVELCWRVHHSGARVIVAPAARVRHVGDLPARRPDLDHRKLEARHRMRAVATLTGAARLPGRLLELVVLTIAELAVGLFTGTFGQAWASLRALVGLVPRVPSIVGRRRVVKPLRRVPEREVAGLQSRGSARLNSFLRTRDTATYVGSERAVRRWRESTTAPVIAWLAVIAAIIVGSRSFITGGVPEVGEFLRFPESPRLLLESYVSGWNPTGAGATSPNPTGWATLSGLSTITLFRMGLLQTVFVIGLVVVGLMGLWKLVALFPSTRARIAALLVYAASPLVSGAMSSGRLSVLVAYAAVPWIVHTLRVAVGIGTADPRLADADLPDGLQPLDRGERVRRTLGVVLVLAVATAMAPIVLVVGAVVGMLLAVGSALASASWRTTIGFAVVSAVGVVGAAALNAPWIASWSWAGLVGASPLGDPGLGLVHVASFEIGVTDLAALSLALYLPVLAAIALARAWRLTWAVRAGALVLGFGALAVLGDRGALPFQPPEPGVLLVPVALGVAISSAAGLAAFDLDVRGGEFGWRQPLGVLASAAVLVGIVPGVIAVGDGAWNTPTTPIPRLLDASLPDENAGGDYSVLMIGDARLLPVPAEEYRDGISWALFDDGPLDVRDRWMPPSNDAADTITLALDEMAASSTLRAGRLLAPLGIRYIIVPEFDGVVSTTTDPLPLPGGLVSALEDQLDISTITGLPTLEVFENRAWLPTVSVLTGATAEASDTAGAEALVRADLSSATPAFLGADQFSTTTDDVDAGVVHLAVPFDDHWELSVDGQSAEARRAFGITTAFDVAGGSAALTYSTVPMRALLVGVQTLLWIAALFGATRVTVPLSRRAPIAASDETLIDLDALGAEHADDADTGPHETGSGGEAGEILDPGLDLTGQISRLAEPGPPEAAEPAEPGGRADSFGEQR